MGDQETEQQRRVRQVFGFVPAGEQEKIATEAMLENYPNGTLRKVYSFANADFADPERVPSGILSIHPMKARVHPDSVPDELFESLVVCKIHDPSHKLGDADFAGKEAQLLEEIPQFSANPPRLFGVAPQNVEDRDVATWSAEIGENGYVGIFKKLADNHRDNDYYVVVQAGAPVACREFKRGILHREHRTFEELMFDPAYNFTKNIARRNAERLAYCAARAVGCDILKEPDVSAFTPHSYIAQPYRATPRVGLCQTVSSIEPISWGGKRHAAVYHKVRSMNRSQESCFVTAGPYDGVTIFNMRGKTTGLGVPVSTGIRNRNVDASKVNEEEMEKRARGFTWEKQTSAYHPELLPGKHARVDDEYLEKMKQLGWKQKGINNRTTLIPVIVKLSNPEIKRAK